MALHTAAKQLLGCIDPHAGTPLKRPHIRRLQRRLQRRCHRLAHWGRLGRWLTPRLLPSIRSHAALAGPSHDALSPARTLLRELNANALHQLQTHCQGELALALISCRPRRQQGQACQQRFQAWSAPVIRVWGNPQLPDWCFQFNSASAELALPCGDHYEDLADKLVILCLVLSLLDTPPAVLKIDDDAEPSDEASLRRLLAGLPPNTAAAGLRIRPEGQASLDRAWHLGKSQHSNQRIFDSLAPQEWLSGGAGYLLTTNGLRLLGDHALTHWGFVQSMLYEDVCISMLLQASQATIVWLEDPAQLGISTERLIEHRLEASHP